MENNIAEKNEYNLRAAELKSLIFESLLNPEKPDRETARRSVEELREIDPHGEFLDRQMLKFYQKYMRQESEASKRGEWASEQARAVYHRKKLGKLIFTIMVVLLVVTLSIPKLIILSYRLDPNVQQPIMKSETADLDQSKAWRESEKAIKIACDNTGIHMMFPSWMPDGLECTAIGQSFSAHSNSININFAKLGYKKGENPSSFVWLEISRLKYSALKGDSRVILGVWEKGTHYTVRHVNQRDYYIGADMDGRGYLTVFVDKQYIYEVITSYSFDTNIQILESLEKFN